MTDEAYRPNSPPSAEIQTAPATLIARLIPPLLSFSAAC